ncbi:MAG TPA: LysR family transcriptional regulator [Hyphomicrobiales bacterium]|nr:LysR family transcriptional regulator [Hyphomicrobiales bacterium]
MDWSRIPSLSALRAYEATTRCGSYAEAARELNVTEAAIRQQVRSLEAFFGVSLIERFGRTIGPTTIGSDFSLRLADGFGRIQNAVERLQDSHEASAVRVALTPAFAENWLMPRLPLFWDENPGIQIDLAPSLKNADLTQGKHDLALRYGTGPWEGHEAHYLASAEYTVVASPKLELPSIVTCTADLSDAVWLFENSREEHRRWAAENGVNFAAPRNRLYPNNSIVLSAVRAGHGLSVQSRALVETDTATGALIPVLQQKNDKLGYYLLHYGPLRKHASVFVEWILNMGAQKIAIPKQ